MGGLSSARRGPALHAGRRRWRMAYDYGRYFGEIALTHDLTSVPGERRWRLTPPGREPELHRIVLYLGCNVLRTSHMIQTITAIFDRLGLDYVAVGGATYCCGIVHHQQGDTEAGGGMSRHTIDLFKRFEPEEVVEYAILTAARNPDTARASAPDSGPAVRRGRRMPRRGRGRGPACGRRAN